MGDKVISKSGLVCRMHETKFTQRLKELHSEQFTEDSLYSNVKKKKRFLPGFQWESHPRTTYSAERNNYKSHMFISI